MITVYIDFKCPASYLAFHPTLSLAKRLEVDVFWKPFRTRQSSIPREREEETRGEAHRRIRAVQRRRTHKHYAALRGLEMNFREDPGSSDAALAALTLNLGSPLEYVRAAFEAYWKSGASLADVPTVVKLLQTSGNSDSANVLVEALRGFNEFQTNAEEQGIFIAPTYITGEHIFVGREHLPLIEQTLLQVRSRGSTT